MRLGDFLDPALVICDLQAKDSRDLLSQISERVCKLHRGLDKKVLLGKLQEREEKSSSGLECGIAVPHAMVPGVEKTICVAIRLAGDIDFKTMDGSPVCMVFALISPPDAVAAHIRLLARIARLCSDPAFIDKMLAADDAAALHQAILTKDNRHV
jgi:PTS system nitrogen regulatory IIA component